MTLEEIASRLSLTRERVRQIELGALKKIWARLGMAEGEGEEAQPATGFRRASRVAA
jgi:DNA-directed RNA polymerase sigma subunit (sigma70/sigma32)